MALKAKKSPQDKNAPVPQFEFGLWKKKKVIVKIAFTFIFQIMNLQDFKFLSLVSV